MNVSSERSQSLWMATAPSVHVPALEIDEQADVVVIGSGIAGLSTAYELAVAGKDVVVIDRGPLGRGMTARTSAHLTFQSDDGFERLIGIHGADKARLYYESHNAAIDRIEQVQKAESIDCEFARIDGYLFAPTGKKVLARELKTIERLGIVGVGWADRAPMPGTDTGRCLRFPMQARFHPLHYLDGLADAIAQRGGRLFAETAASAIHETKNGVTVTTDGGFRIRARACVVATNSPVIIPVGMHEKQVPYRSYTIAATVPTADATDALICDTLDPYHYVRLQPGKGGTSLLIVGGQDHKAGEASDMTERVKRLERWARRHYPTLGDVKYRWSGQLLEPNDCLAFIGRKPRSKHVYFATGDSGDGLTHGVAAALLLRDLIIDGNSTWADLYSPSRRPAKAPAKFHREKGAKPGAKPRKTGKLEDLRLGEGAIIRHDKQEIAAFRDEHGRIHQRSASCTHQGCAVKWNPFERCWDCPCHGSHFAPDGTALNAPAVEPLKEIKRALDARAPAKVGAEAGTESPMRR